MREARERRFGEGRNLRAHKVQVEPAHGQMTLFGVERTGAASGRQLLVRDARVPRSEGLSAFLDFEVGVRRLRSPAAEPEHFAVVIDVRPQDSRLRCMRGSTDLPKSHRNRPVRDVEVLEVARAFHAPFPHSLFERRIGKIGRPATVFHDE